MSVHITPCEATALDLLCHGKTNAQIAHELGIAEHTVKNRLIGLYRKLDVADRAEAAAVWTRGGTDTEQLVRQLDELAEHAEQVVERIEDQLAELMGQVDAAYGTLAARERVA